MESTKGTAGVAVALILFFFLMPWITVSCGGTQFISFSGYDLAAGKEIGGFGDRTDSDPVLFLVPLAALAAIGFVFGSKSTRDSGRGQVLCALVGLCALGLKWIALQESQTPEITITTEFGLWGTVGGLLLLFVAGIMTSGKVNTEEVSDQSPTSGNRGIGARASPPSLEQTTPREQESKPILADADKESWPERFCPNGHGPLPPQSKFCHLCGAGAAEIPLVISCQNCGASLLADALFCSQCGQDVPARETMESSHVAKPVPKTIRSQPPQLSVEEKQVLKLLVQGSPHQEIADRLSMRPIEVSVIITDLLERFGAADKAKLVKLAREMGNLTSNE